MSVSWYLDPGHGGSDSGAVSSVYNNTEKTLNLIVAKLMQDYAEEYYDVDIRMSRQTDRTVSLSDRTDEANALGVDYFISLHFNAFDSVAEGYEDFVYEGLSDSSSTARFRDAYHARITDFLDKYNIPNRGKKKRNFHVLRESNMSAILIEFLFLDNENDDKLINKSGFLEEYAEVVVDALADATGVKRTRPDKPKGPESKGGFYRVIVDGEQVGAWKVRENLISSVERELDRDPKTITVERV